MGDKNAVLAAYDQERKLYERFAQEVEHQLRRILEEKGIACNAITSRLKERDSLSKKIDSKNDKYDRLSEVTDIAGVRVITYYNDDVDRVAEIVEQEFSVDRENSIDKRKALDPDRFGYCSVHYVVELGEELVKRAGYKAFAGLKCEIQIRTVLQHAWAEIEHDLGYKSEVGVPRDIRRSFSRLAGLLEVADKEFQEIRTFLTEYRHKLETEPKNSADELDAVVLEVLLSKDPELQELNRRLGEIAGMGIEDKVSTFSVESSLHELRWLHITTTGALRECTARNKQAAVKLAEYMLKDQYKRSEKGAKLSKTIGLFYLCYAELILGDYSEEQIASYYVENQIVSTVPEKNEYDMAINLLEIGKKVDLERIS